MADDFGLTNVIQNDGSIDNELRLKYKSLAELYESDFENNLQKTSLELNKHYNTGNPVIWREFLSHTSVKNFIDNYLYEIAEKKAMKALGQDIEKPTQAIKIKEVVDKKKKKNDNSNIIVMLLPEKEDLGL